MNILTMTDAQRGELAAAARVAALLPIAVASQAVGSQGNGPGVNVDNLVGQEDIRLNFGIERLYRWLNNLKGGVATSIGIVGDSNWAAYAGPILQALLAQLPGVTIVNYAIGGTTLKQWVGGTGPFASNGLAMSNCIAAGHDLILMGYGGTNTPSVDTNGSPASFAADLDAAMTAIRAGANGAVGRCSVALFTSAAQNDGIDNTAATGSTWKRDPLFNATVRPLIMAAARKYSCAFFDKNGRYPDSMVDFAAGSTGVNTWLDLNRVHTVNAFADLIAQDIFEWLVPSVYRNASTRVNITPGGGGFTQPGTLENMSTKRIGSHVYLEGRLNHAGLATINKGQYLFSINSIHRPRIQVWNAMIQLFDGTNQPMTPLRVNVQQDGQVIAAEAFMVFTTTSVRMRADWECVGY